MDTSVASGLQVGHHVATNRYQLLCDQYSDQLLGRPLCNQLTFTEVSFALQSTFIKAILMAL